MMIFPLRLCLPVLAFLIVLSTAAQESPILSPRQCRASATLSADYLCRIVGKDGRFVYCYNPLNENQSVTYNWLRHAGTIVALAQTYEVAREERYKTAALKAIRALKGQIRKVTVGDVTYEVLVSDPDTTGARLPRPVSVKTGGCGLATIALLQVDRITGRQDHKGLILKQCHYLRMTQLPNGDLRSKLYADSGKWSDFHSDYYAGEALVALALTQAAYPVAENRKTMIRLFAFLLRGWFHANQMNEHRASPFDHWGMIGTSYALPQLEEKDFGPWLGSLQVTREAILDIVIQYCDNELNRQLRGGVPQLTGSFKRRPGGLTPTAIRLEGFTAIANLVKEAGNEKQKSKVKLWIPKIDRARRFMIRCQYTGAEKFGRKLDLDITGGFRRAYSYDRRRKRTNAEIRIDYCQHAISALIEWPRPEKKAE